MAPDGLGRSGGRPPPARRIRRRQGLARIDVASVRREVRRKTQQRERHAAGGNSIIVDVVAERHQLLAL